MQLFCYLSFRSDKQHARTPCDTYVTFQQSSIRRIVSAIRSEPNGRVTRKHGWGKPSSALRHPTCPELRYHRWCRHKSPDDGTLDIGPLTISQYLQEAELLWLKGQRRKEVGGRMVQVSLKSYYCTWSVLNLLLTLPLYLHALQVSKSKLS
ncbi:hypothetical protein PoMZ_03677 [Pyricularia oryzae]|uniref:Uncharacterized protein n=1 Tax=Pyricularia oryzae TaxID=318829 RepID=A0A4P7N8B5_PYROR|nr:hypothetical protein PoMZ_03677 [Pyricularia oryzae]